MVGEDHTPAPQLGRLHIVDHLDMALDRMESELLTRAHTDADTATPRTEELVLVATPAPHLHRRLQAVLDNGSTLGLAGVLIGQWRPGATVRIRTDGTVAATSTSLTNSLEGTWLFTVPPPDSQALLNLLGEADPPRHELPAVAEPPTRDSCREGASSTSRAKHTPSSPEPTDRTTALSPSNSPSTDSAELLDTEPPPTSAPEPNSQAPSPPNTHTRQPPAAPHAEPEGTTSTGDPDRGERLPQDSRNIAEATPQRPHQARSSTPADTPLRLNLLGNLQVVHHHDDNHQDITSALAPRQREVLAFLALHPNGARRETLTAALWPEAPADRPYNALHATLSQLRRALRTATHKEALAEAIARQDGPYTLDPERVSVDLWEAYESLDAARPGHSYEHRLAAAQRLGELYRGDLAEDVTAEWIEAPREALRRDVLDAFSALAHTLDDTDPQQALILLERARTLDRYNEALYTGIARLQARLGQRDAVARTLALLTKTLGELDEDPSQETVSLCEFLRRSDSADSSRAGLAEVHRFEDQQPEARKVVDSSRRPLDPQPRAGSHHRSGGVSSR
ncbi:DNA-binding transcriptional activator of the SARP family [Streptomyces melanosporofaciens]|uniref:DNA-binding transcriptional activator of the SARP family n=1 Tax=Streptomyces melanosporofaciens TaxID=67327 RepID=A0A1H4KQL2_STRMJ|nr:DNA-binding transcriptional activator of the SARP family [Streptomyces melanosporofaciens]